MQIYFLLIEFLIIIIGKFWYAFSKTYSCTNRDKINSDNKCSNENCNNSTYYSDDKKKLVRIFPKKKRSADHRMRRKIDLRTECVYRNMLVNFSNVTNVYIQSHERIDLTPT